MTTHTTTPAVAGGGRLRVVLATPLSEELCELVERIEPRIDLVRDQSLLPPQQHPGDHHGDPAFVRSAAQQGAFDRMLDTAEALYGIPNESPAALRRTVRANPLLRWVHTTPAGGGAQVRGAELSAGELERIAFTQSGGVHAEPLSEFALLGTLAGLKNLPRLQEAQAEHRWGPRFGIRTVSDLHVVVVGLGGIGRAVARKMSLLGADVTGVHRRQVEAPGVGRIVPVGELARAVAVADVVVMTLPGTESTRGMLGADILAAVKPGVTIVNVGRGNTIDEVALVAALADGRVGYAALDVFATEPLAADSPLWDMPNVLVSPHTSALHSGEDRLIAELFADNAGRLLDGRELRNRVNTVEFY